MTRKKRLYINVLMDVYIPWPRDPMVCLSRLSVVYCYCSAVKRGDIVYQYRCDINVAAAAAAEVAVPQEIAVPTSRSRSSNSSCSDNSSSSSSSSIGSYGGVGSCSCCSSIQTWYIALIPVAAATTAAA